MLNRTSTIGIFGIIIVLLVCLAGLTWINLQFTYWGYGGNDFYINWSATRGLIFDGISPYSGIESAEIQALESTKEFIFNAEGGVISSPAYSLILTFPFAFINDFEVARAFWITSLEIAVIISILVLLNITKWRPRSWEFALLFMSVYLSHLAFMAYISGNMIVWTTLFLILALKAINVNRNEIAGGLLAFTTFQPQIFILAIVFILFWAITNKRKLIIAWFFGIVFILTSISLLVIPAWPQQYLKIFVGFLDYFSYMIPRSEITQQWRGIGIQLSWAITIIVSIILILEIWFARGKDTRWFSWTTCLVIVLTRLIGAPVHVMHNYVLLLPLIYVYSIIHERFKKVSGWIAILIIFTVVVGWVYLLDHILINPNSSQLGLYYLLPLFLLIALYWIRWWAIQPPSLYIQEMHLRG